MKVVVFGATGVVGRAAAEHFGARRDCNVVAISRRAPDLPGVEHVALDLADAEATASAMRSSALAGTTHVVFAALQESPDLAAGWRDPELIAHNAALFRNALEPLTAACASSLRHVSLLQGAKAYGFHVGRASMFSFSNARRISSRPAPNSGNAPRGMALKASRWIARVTCPTSRANSAGR